MRNVNGEILFGLLLTMKCGARFSYGTTSYGVAPGPGGMPITMAAAAKKSLPGARLDCPDCSFDVSRRESRRCGRTVHQAVQCIVAAVDIQATE